MNIPITYCQAHQCGWPLDDDSAYCPHGLGVCERHAFEDACDACAEGVAA